MSCQIRAVLSQEAECDEHANSERLGAEWNTPRTIWPLARQVESCRSFSRLWSCRSIFHLSSVRARSSKAHVWSEGARGPARAMLSQKAKCDEHAHSERLGAECNTPHTIWPLARRSCRSFSRLWCATALLVIFFLPERGQPKHIIEARVHPVLPDPSHAQPRGRMR